MLFTKEDVKTLSKEEILQKIADTTMDGVVALANKIFAQKPTLAGLGPVKHVMDYDKVVERLK